MSATAIGAGIVLLILGFILLAIGAYLYSRANPNGTNNLTGTGDYTGAYIMLILGGLFILIGIIALIYGAYEGSGDTSSSDKTKSAESADSEKTYKEKYINLSNDLKARDTAERAINERMFQPTPIIPGKPAYASTPPYASTPAYAPDQPYARGRVRPYYEPRGPYYQRGQYPGSPGVSVNVGGP